MLYRAPVRPWRCRGIECSRRPSNSAPSGGSRSARIAADLTDVSQGRPVGTAACHATGETANELQRHASWPANCFCLVDMMYRPLETQDRPVLWKTFAAAWLALCASAALAATRPSVDEQALRRTLAPDLEDVGSAMFKYLNLRQSSQTDGRWLVCGQFNARNGMGTYPGFVRFFVVADVPEAGAALSRFSQPVMGDGAERRCAAEGLNKRQR